MDNFFSNIDLHFVWLFHLGSTAVMFGLIWFVQVVHYPLFLKIRAEDFESYEAAHQTRTSVVVMPAMLTEIATGAWLFFSPQFLNTPLFVTSLWLLGVTWASTFFIQVPLHQKLSSGYDSVVIKRLVLSNWIRTFSWSARFILLIQLVPRSF